VSDVVYLSRVLWDSIYQRPHHLAVGLSATRRVLWVDTPRSTAVQRLLKPLAGGRLPRPLLWQPDAAHPNLTVLSPAYVPYLPGRWPPPGQYALSRFFLRQAVGRLGMTSPVVWTQDPRDLAFVDMLAPRLVCYDCMDDYGLIAPAAGGQPPAREQELALLRRADIVFASSTELAQRCAQTNPRTVLVPNGVDAAFFAAGEEQAAPAGLASIPAPRIGYVGSLAAWVDVELLAGVARARPDWSLVLVGPALKGVEGALDALRRLPNVFVLGERPYASIPAYLQSFAVCLIPFRLNGLTRAVNPVKFYEYMAAGRPVVATPLPELAPFAGACALASNTAGFVAAIAAALAEGDTAARRHERLALARAHTWAQRVATIEDAMAAAPGV